MHKHLENIFRISFCIFFLALIAGIYFYGLDGYKYALIVGVFASIICLTTALYEVLSSKKVGVGNKVLWVLFMLSFNTLGALVYYLSGRKTIKERD